jgi:hypothetical protein
VEIEHDSPKVNVFCAASRRCVFSPIFFVEKSIMGQVYLKMFQNWLMPELVEEEGFIFQQDSVVPNWHMGVQEYLNGLVLHQLQTSSAHCHPSHMT